MLHDYKSIVPHKCKYIAFTGSGFLNED